MSADPAVIKARARFLREETVRLIAIAKTATTPRRSPVPRSSPSSTTACIRLRRGEPDWPDRDRFLLGKGHAAVGLYPLLAGLDYFPAGDLDEVRAPRQPVRRSPRHAPDPRHRLQLGVARPRAFGRAGDGARGRLQDTTTRLRAARRRGAARGAGVGGGDGCRSSSPRTLVAIVDRNDYWLDGSVEEVIGIEPLADKWRPSVGRSVDVDGHDVRRSPVFAAAATDDAATARGGHREHGQGQGRRYMEREPGWHLGYLDPADEERALAETPGGR